MIGPCEPKHLLGRAAFLMLSTIKVGATTGKVPCAHVWIQHQQIEMFCAKSSNRNLSVKKQGSNMILTRRTPRPKALHQHPQLQFSQDTSAQCRGKFSAQDGPTPCRHPTPQTPRIFRQSGTSMKRSFSQVWRQVSSWIDVKNPSTTFMCAMCARNVF